MLCVVEALDVVARWCVIGAPAHLKSGCMNERRNHLYTWLIMCIAAGTSLWSFGSGRFSVMLSRK